MYIVYLVISNVFYGMMHREDQKNSPKYRYMFMAVLVLLVD